METADEWNLSYYRDRGAQTLAEDLLRAVASTEHGARALLDNSEASQIHVATCCYDAATALLSYANDCAETPRTTKGE